jgi:hypothetical protein
VPPSQCRRADPDPSLHQSLQTGCRRALRPVLLPRRLELTREPGGVRSPERQMVGQRTLAREVPPGWSKAQERMRSALPSGSWDSLFALLPDITKAASNRLSGDGNRGEGPDRGKRRSREPARPIKAPRALGARRSPPMPRRRRRTRRVWSSCSGRRLRRRHLDRWIRPYRARGPPEASDRSARRRPR